MATITLTVEGSTVGTLAVTKTLSSTDSDRLMAYLANAYGVDALGEPRTPVEMVAAYWDAITAGTLANVQNYEREKAAKLARDAITDIVPL